MDSLRKDIEDTFSSLKDSERFINVQGNLEMWSISMIYSLQPAVMLGFVELDQAERALRRVMDARPQLQKVAENHGEWLQLYQDLVANEPAAVEMAKLRQFQEDHLELEFAAVYKDPEEKIISYLVGCIDRLYKKWSSRLIYENWYAPCTAIVQSSGWGKSRAMREIAMAQNKIVVFYFSLMDENHSGYPKADRDILKHFKGITKVEHGYRVFHACFEWLSEQHSFPSKEELFKDHEQKRYQRVLQRLKDRSECTAKEMSDECSNVQKQHASALRREGVAFLFVFDEARSLLKSKNEMGDLPFVLLRRASSQLPQFGQSFVLFIDTTSRVSNFTPPAGLDPSAKVNKGREKLFAPISRLPTFDLMVDPAPLLVDANAPPPLTSAKGFPSPDVWLRQGRPLGAAKEFDGRNWSIEILNFALIKLCGGLTEDMPGFQGMLEKPYMSLVMLGRRLGVEICSQSPSAEELVASHMSVCLHVSASREYLYCTSLPEPVLNEAAACYLRGHRRRLCTQLQQLNSLLLKGIASAGERGELVARFLMIDVMDTLQSGQSLTVPVYLQGYLGKLFHDFDPKELPSNLEKAKVFFNAFHRFFGKPSVTDARKFIKKGVAMICAAMQQALDLYIFFVKPDEHGQYDVENDNCIGCMAVHVKNWKFVSGIKLTAAGMREYANKIPADEISPDLMLLLHVGPNKTKKDKKELMKGNYGESERGQSSRRSGPKKPVYVAKGLDMIFVNNDISETIEQLLTQSPDPVTIMCEEVRGLTEAGVDNGTEEEVYKETKALKSILAAVYPEDKAGKQEESSGKASKKRKHS